MLSMVHALGTAFFALLGLAFGSFLNVCLSRWPSGESVVRPRSHCRSCGHALAWWENVPLVSWLALRGRCRKCRAWIGWRYPVVELAMGVLWAASCWPFFQCLVTPGVSSIAIYDALAIAVGEMIFFWLTIALAALDAENLWLPDWITLPGVALLFIVFLLRAELGSVIVTTRYGAEELQHRMLFHLVSEHILGILAAAGLILLIRWIYWLIRRREGIGLGDAKLMAMLAAWLGLSGALLAFGLGVVLGAAVALVLLLTSASRAGDSAWALRKLPLGTFLCVGGIVSALWGQPIVAAYLRWAGFR
ncbi:MAG: prepilin peptidase [Terracidiphilus sp.]